MNDKTTLANYNALNDTYCRAVGRTDCKKQYAEQLELLAAEAKADAVQAEKHELVLKEMMYAAREEMAQEGIA
jgi:hypothetical protein